MIGSVVGKYRIEALVGRGGMGTVYRALDQTLQRDVAIKVLNADLNDPGIGRRFRAEAVAIARLNHPGIATIFELLQHDGQWLMVMEFVRGDTLEALMVRKGRLETAEAADLTVHMLAALAHAHAMGVIHRDLKPANIMATGAGVKIMDFGIARVAGTEHLTRAGFLMGTPAYMAPEQVKGGDVDARTDLFAVGVVLYQLVSGVLPFKGHTPMEMAQSRLNDPATPVRTSRRDLPGEIAVVIDRALAREPAARFQTADEFRTAVERATGRTSGETPVAIAPEYAVTIRPGELPVIPASASGQAQPASRPAVPPSAPASSMAGASLTARPGSAGNGGATAATGVAGATPSALAETMAPRQLHRAAPSGGLSRAWILTGAGLLLVAATILVLRPRSESAAGVEPVSRRAEATPAPAAPQSTPATGEAAKAPAAATPAAAQRAMGGPAAPASATTTSTPPVSAGSLPLAGSAPPAGSAAPARSRAARGAKAPADAPLSFSNIRQTVVTGTQGSNRDAVLTFGQGQISILSPKDGAPLDRMAYGSLVRASYVRARRPVWDASLPAPPADTDMPGSVFSGARHWLTLQSKAAYLIVGLDEATWTQVVEAVTARTGVAVTQPGR